MSHATPEEGLRGRRSECETIDRILVSARAGRSQVLVLRGEAGVGKTALLDYLSNRVAGWHVAWTVGVESEMELAYSGLHQLCAPLLDLLERLPIPQRNALATVFGLSTGPVPDRFLVGLATLTLMAEDAEQQPLACIVDDAQWLDQASAQILAFVGRRLVADRVALVCAARTGVGDEVLAGLPTLPIRGLGDSEARTLLLGSLHAPLDSVVCDQIITESHGNPLALLELARMRSAGELAGGFGLPEIKPVTGKIEQNYLRRLAPLPSATRLLVLAAAAEPLGDPVLLQRAALALDIDMAAAVPAVDAGLLIVRGRVEFTHPLVRSAVYWAAASEDRCRVHRALARATDAAAAPDRRAWHRSRATPGPDQDVAAELERSAGRAQLRGGFAAAAAFMTRATELTAVPTQRVRRALDAAFANVAAGAFDRARTQLTIARYGPVDELQRARTDLLRAQLAIASSRGNEATPLLLAAAHRLEPLDGALAHETYLDALAAAMFVNEGVGVTDVARAARAALRRSDDEPTAADLLLDALVALTDDYRTAAPLCRAALQQLSSDQMSPKERLRRLWLGCVIALEMWDDESAYSPSYDDLGFARKTGALSELALGLTARTPLLVFCGEVSAAASLVAEARSVEEVTGISAAPHGALIVAAWRGHAREATELIAATTREASSPRQGVGIAISEYARAVLCNGSSQYAEGLIAARSATRFQELVAENWGLTELIESATRTGRTDLASTALSRLAQKARASGTDWALGVEARSRALLSGDESAEGLFREAIEHLGRTRVRAELARAHLLYGEWLRRTHRRVDARSELTIAYESFVSMGLEGFAERTLLELLATGATVGKRGVEKRHDLTAQEAQIAGLARDGRSNPEIAAQLFISARTVEWHLRKVFTKLDISSRRQLPMALPDSGESVART